MEQIVNLILLFFAFSFLGWCIEVTLKFFQYHRFINRGFLTGPWLPIYGSGAVLITLGVRAVAPYESGFGISFAVSFLLCGALEYTASFCMEKRFHARWWDYSQKPMNLHGRVWIGNLILFGLGGVLIVHLLDPLLFSLYARLRPDTREVLAGVLTALFLGDYVVSHFVLKLVKNEVERSQADNTEEISRQVRLTLRSRSVFHRRFADAYPEVIYKTERITARLEAIRAESERLRKQAEERVGQVGRRLNDEREQLAARLEVPGTVKNELIEKQSELIRLLYDEGSATDEMRDLKREIDAKSGQLQDRSLLARIGKRDSKERRSS